MQQLETGGQGLVRYRKQGAQRAGGINRDVWYPAPVRMVLLAACCCFDERLTIISTYLYCLLKRQIPMTI